LLPNIDDQTYQDFDDRDSGDEADESDGESGESPAYKRRKIDGGQVEASQRKKSGKTDAGLSLEFLRSGETHPRARLTGRNLEWLEWNSLRQKMARLGIVYTHDSIFATAIYRFY